MFHIIYIRCFFRNTKSVLIFFLFYNNQFRALLLMKTRNYLMINCFIFSDILFVSSRRFIKAMFLFGNTKSVLFLFPFFFNSFDAFRAEYPRGKSIKVDKRGVLMKKKGLFFRKYKKCSFFVAVL